MSNNEENPISLINEVSRIEEINTLANFDYNDKSNSNQIGRSRKIVILMWLWRWRFATKYTLCHLASLAYENREESVNKLLKRLEKSGFLSKFSVPIKLDYVAYVLTKKAEKWLRENVTESELPDFAPLCDKSKIAISNTVHDVACQKFIVNRIVSIEKPIFFASDFELRKREKSSKKANDYERLLFKIPDAVFLEYDECQELRAVENEDGKQLILVEIERTRKTEQRYVNTFRDIDFAFDHSYNSNCCYFGEIWYFVKNENHADLIDRAANNFGLSNSLIFAIVDNNVNALLTNQSKVMPLPLFEEEFEEEELMF